MSRRFQSTAILLILPLILGWLGWQCRWVAEDGFLFLRVVENLLAGYGPVWNVDERVEIFTSPLWVGLLAAAGALFPRIALEWLAVGLGLLSSVVGLLAAEFAALLLYRGQGWAGPVLPLGALVVTALPPYWDFATSGLETGLAIAWLGLSFWGLVHLWLAREGRQGASSEDLESGGGTGTPLWLGISIGLGPLVRPDLAVMSIGFLGLLALLCWPASWRRYARLAVAVGVAPAIYQVFRMGYFAALVPNTALAKDAFRPYWAQGWHYLRDFIGVYWLWIPLLVLGATGLMSFARISQSRRWRLAALIAVPVLSGLVHGVYIVRVGGDFMHGRMLLPSLFACLLPVSVVAAPRWRMAIGPALIVVPWAIVCALWLRVPYRNAIDPLGIADERGVHAFHIRPHPVTLGDYAIAHTFYDGRALRQLALDHRGLVLGDGITADHPAPRELPVARTGLAPIVAARLNVGILGYAAGPTVHVVDRLGLGDAIGSRLRVEQRGRPGHEKWLSDAWVFARFADPAEPLPPGAPPVEIVRAARSALACPSLSELLAAIEAHLTPSRFARNLGVAWRLRNLSIPADPRQAAAELCEPR